MHRSAVALLFLLPCFMAAVPQAHAFAPAESAAYEIPFPGDQYAPEYDMAVQDQLAAQSPGWQRFVADLGPNWRAFLWSEANQIPNFAAGAPIPLLEPGYHSEAEVAQRTRTFLDGIDDLIRVSTQDLQFQSLEVFGDQAQVFFEQRYSGLPVFDGLLRLHFDHGALNAIGADLYPDIHIDTRPALSEQAAAAQALAGMPAQPQATAPEEVTLGVLPMVWGSEVGHFLVYRVVFSTSDPFGRWASYVDAQSGELYWRFSLIDYYTINGTDRGDIQPRRADDPYSDLPQPYQEAVADGHTVHTNPDGTFSVTVTNNQSYTVTAYNRGYYVRVNDYLEGGAVDQISTTASPSNPAVLYWDDSNTNAAERDAYHSVNVVHDWVKSTDPTWTGMDFQVACFVNDSGCSCNAFWNGSLNMCAEGGGCNNTAQIADIIYHEYHHGVTQHTYSPQGPPTTSGMNEGFSDFCAMCINNSSCMSPSFYQSNPDGCMRNGMNYRQYPGSECSGEVHCLGEILMGALWKVRRNLLAKYGEDFAQQVSNYFRTALRAKATNMPTFAQYFLMADDDNGDLADGTPDYYEICDGFGEHNIPCPNITKKIVFTHTALADREQATPPAVVHAEITTTTGSGSIIPDSTKVYYSYNGTTYTAVTMTHLSGNVYEAQIPLLPGILVDYYLRSATTTGVKGTDPIRAPAVNRHRFLVGATTEVLFDDLEADQGWTIGAPDDDATSGVWQRANPVGKEYDGETVQPENDHTPAPGVNCFVTDARGGFYSNYNVDAGKTSVISPAFDFSSGSAGYVEFCSFLANIGQAPDDSLMVYASGNGTDWALLWQIHGRGHNNAAYEHQKVYFRSEDFDFSSDVRFKFVAEDNENNTITEAAVDDIRIRAILESSGAEDGAGTPLVFAALPAAPSPFATQTTLRFQLPERRRVELRIFDTAGRLVRTLTNRTLDGGRYAIAWDGRSDAGHAAPSGIYYSVLTAGANQVTHKLVLTR